MKITKEINHIYEENGLKVEVEKENGSVKKVYFWKKNDGDNRLGIAFSYDTVEEFERDLNFLCRALNEYKLANGLPTFNIDLSD